MNGAWNKPGIPIRIGGFPAFLWGKVRKPKYYISVKFAMSAATLLRCHVSTGVRRKQRLKIKKTRTADQEEYFMNTGATERTTEEMETVNGGFLDDFFDKVEEILTDIGTDAIQSFCSHNYIRTGATRMRPFCCKDVPQYEVWCTKCNHKKWVED